MNFEAGDELISLGSSPQDAQMEACNWENPGMAADEYARWNGLTIDSHFDPWSRLVNNDVHLSATADNVEPGCLFEMAWLHECLFRPIIPTREQWQLPAASLRLVEQACKPDAKQEVAASMNELCKSEATKLSNLKFELPALSSDPESDRRQVARAVDEFKKVQLPDHDVPLFPANDEHNNGLKFPEADKKSDEALMEQMKGECLEVKRESLVFLMQSLKTDWTDADQMKMLESVCTYQGRVGALEPITPPLSPFLAAIPDHFIPTDEDCELPEPSEAGSMLSEDIDTAEKRILEDDICFWGSVAEGQPPSPERYDDLDVSELIRKGELTAESPFASPQPVSRHLKVEVPLFLPEMDDEWEHGKHIVIEPEDLAKARAFIQSSDPVFGMANTPELQLANVFNANADFLTRSAEQEQLQPLDALARVPVPVMDFSVPPPDWGVHPITPSEMFQIILVDAGVAGRKSEWRGGRVAEQSMVWAPLQHMDRVIQVKETIDVDRSVLKSFLAVPKDSEILTSANWLSRRSGLLLTRPWPGEESEIEDEEEQEGEQEEETDNSVTALVLKNQPRLPQQEGRMMLPEIRPQKTQSTQTQKTPSKPSPPAKGKKRALEEMPCQSQPAPKTSTGPSTTKAVSASQTPTISSTNVMHSFLSEYTDCAPLIDNFVKMNTQKKPKLTQSHYFSSSSDTASPILPPESLPAVKPTALMPPPPEPIPAVAPVITAPSIPPKIIVSSTISRAITNLVKTQIPDIDILERDYNKRRPPAWFPGHRSPNTDEADLTISPATGVLLTTMVKLRQKPLPGMIGQPGQVVFRHVVENVARRYESLIIFVSENNKNSETMSPLSDSDAKALVEFQGHAAGLQTDVRVVYVGGGDETLAKWVAAAICKHSPEAVPARDLLLPVETEWEMFLRRAGMNAYAAQVALGILKVPEGEPAIGGRHPYGLPLFIMMSPDERASALEDMLCGRRVLDRVGEVLDESWEQRAVGHFQGDVEEMALDDPGELVMYGQF